ncbi:conserved hypothetical protein [Bradyrhizobium sp. ORS 375]|nr:conserved hypothetical protein [Bradyrhizobium sp. ORS 375]
MGETAVWPVQTEPAPCQLMSVA